MTTLLIVDDDKMQRMVSRRLLESNASYLMEEASGGREALARLSDPARPPVDLVLLDLFMPEMNGRDTLTRIRADFSTLPVVITTGSKDVSDVVELMQLGASDFLVKPITSERMHLCIEQNLTIRTLAGEVARLSRGAANQGQFGDLIGAQGGLAACVALGRKAAASDIPVLITGESGVGKELLARAIHGESHRGGRPFIAINCGAIPENLVESTLFGHEKGSFTGAITREIGKFREAEGGTLLLDEVGELKPGMQTKLLRALQQKEIEPVGAGKPVPVNVRIISATHRTLTHEVAAGRFREDLFYRLNVLPIRMPSLSEHKGDIPLLAEHLLQRFCATERKHPMRIAPDGMEWLCEQRWAGNVRELGNLLYRAVVLSDRQELTGADFAAMTEHEPAGTSDFPEFYVTLMTPEGRTKTWEELEVEVIHATLKRCNGSIPETARLLNMGQSTLYKKLSGKVA